MRPRKRKEIRKPGVWLIVTMCSLILSCNHNSPKQKAPRPNIVFIIADDLAWDDLGCYGHPHIRTPHIDRLAKNGLRFDQAFLTANSCSPSRASIITGKYPHQTDAEQLHWPLPTEQVTFVEKLKAAGYWTGQAGKWHLGEAMKDRFHQVMDVPVGGFQLQKDGKMTTAANESGCEDWIPLLNARDTTKPFFLWLAAVDPHRDYKKGIIETPHSEQEVIVPPYLPDTEAVRKDLALYYDEITRLDSFVGEFIAELDRRQLTDNTLLLFISDNGRPFPRDKTTLYDGGIKTPWIVRWPEVVEPGGQTQSLVSSVDIAPTLLEVAGVEAYPALEGVSFLQVLTDPTHVVRSSVYAEDHWHDFEDYSRAVRTGRYKYIRNYYADLPNTPSADALRSPTFRAMQQLRDENALTEAQMACFIAPRPDEELYDLEADPFELNNLAENRAYADVLRELRDKMEQVRKETNDRLPDRRTPDEFDRETGQPNSFRIRPRPSKAEMRKTTKK